MRTVLKPAALTAFINSCVTLGLPQAVSWKFELPQTYGVLGSIASSELPRFQPGDISFDNCRLVMLRMPLEPSLPPPKDAAQAVSISEPIAVASTERSLFDAMVSSDLPAARFQRRADLVHAGFGERVAQDRHQCEH